jgi:hypothetical protein
VLHCGRRARVEDPLLGRRLLVNRRRNTCGAAAVSLLAKIVGFEAFATVRPRLGFCLILSALAGLTATAIRQKRGIKGSADTATLLNRTSVMFDVDQEPT